jgi:hypothetical protein
MNEWRGLGIAAACCHVWLAPDVDVCPWPDAARGAPVPTYAIRLKVLLGWCVLLNVAANPPCRYQVIMVIMVVHTSRFRCLLGLRCMSLAARHIHCVHSLRAVCYPVQKRAEQQQLQQLLLLLPVR